MYMCVRVVSGHVQGSVVMYMCVRVVSGHVYVC